MNFENEVLRPAVLRRLSPLAAPELQLHVNVSATLAGEQSSVTVGLGKGSPDLVGTIRFMVRRRFGAQLFALELKRKALRAGAYCMTCCLPCDEAARSACCAGSITIIAQRGDAGVLSPEQERAHESWSAGGRWVHTVFLPSEAWAAYQESLNRLRKMGLEPVPVAGRR